MDKITEIYYNVMESAAEIRANRRLIYGDNFISIPNSAIYGNIIWKIERAMRTDNPRKFEDDLVDAINCIIFLIVKRRIRKNG